MAYVAQKGEGGGRITGKLNDTVIRRPIRGGSSGVTKGMYTGYKKDSSKGGGAVKKAASKTGGGSAFYSKVSK